MNNVDNPVSDEISLGDVVTKLKSAIKYLQSKLIIIISLAVLGGILGLAYSIYKKPTFTAVSTFVLEDKSGGGGGMSQYAGLASLAGIDLGGGNSGLFQGDNIIELYKSRLMIERALLSKVDFNGKATRLIDLYIDFNKLTNLSEQGSSTISFDNDPEKFNRKQDSLINIFSEIINKGILSVSKPDKKLSIIRVEVVSKSEAFSMLFTNKLVEVVNSFYVQTKTKKTAQNVALMQQQADSVKLALNSSISGVASSIDASPNANPSLQSLRVPSQRRQVDVQANTAIYAEVIKNLELSKMSLRQETPLIQVIDAPVYPLKVNKVSKISGFITGFTIASICAVFYLFFKKLSIKN